MATPLRDSALVGVGLAVLAVRQASDAVTDFDKRVSERNERLGKGIDQARERAAAVRTQVEELVAPYVERIQDQIEKLVERLPEPAQKTYKDALTAGKQVADTFEAFARTVTTEPAPVKKAASKVASAKAESAA